MSQVRGMALLNLHGVVWCTVRSFHRPLLGASLALCACRPSVPTARAPQHDPWSGRGRECVRPFVGRDSPYSELLDNSEADAPVLARVPAEASRTMRAAGMSTLVARALSSNVAGEAPTIATLVTRQDLGMRLISLETQLAAMIFEAECTGELIEAMTFELEDRGDLRELRLALGSLVVGALSATVAGLWDLSGSASKGPALLGLTGGIASATLGGSAFIKRTQRMNFAHERNLLRAVVSGTDDSELFPRFVFRLLTMPAHDGGSSPRERLIARWQELIDEVVDAEDREGAMALLYGDGGTYSQALMSLRERLYDVLESELNAQARDLELLDRFLVRALAQS